MAHTQLACVETQNPRHAAWPNTEPVAVHPWKIRFTAPVFLADFQRLAPVVTLLKSLTGT